MRLSAETNFSICYDITGSEQSFIADLQIQKESTSRYHKT